MNSRIDPEIPAVEAAEPAADDHAIVRTLLDIYVAAGLSLNDALRSALADYECQFVPALPCAA